MHKLKGNVGDETNSGAYVWSHIKADKDLALIPAVPAYPSEMIFHFVNKNYTSTQTEKMMMWCSFMCLISKKPNIFLHLN